METPATSPAPPIAPPAVNPHVFSRQLIGLILWVGVPTLLLGLGTCIICLTLASLTFADAWKSGIYKRSDGRGFLNISPMAWGISMALLFVVAFPVYILHRSELRTIQATNGFFWALVIVGAGIAISFVGYLILWM